MTWLKKLLCAADIKLLQEQLAWEHKQRECAEVLLRNLVWTIDELKTMKALKKRCEYQRAKDHVDMGFGITSGTVAFLSRKE